MSARRSVARGFLLAEILGLLAIAMLILVVLGQLVLTANRLQRSATGHTDRMSVADDLYQQLWTDSLQTIESRQVDDRTLLLKVHGRAGQSEVRYTFAEDAVERSADGAAEQVWSARQLIFGWEMNPTGAGLLLALTFTEERLPSAGLTEPHGTPFSTALVFPVCRAGGAP
jgi:Tfp pilus assembly protein PilV